jgi:ubiquinone/menaquinone biosynthesis C-methylase UbiE
MQHRITFDPVESRNQSAYDRMARDGHVLASVATADELRRPLEAIDTSRWLGPSIHGWNVLCLAAAGGRHSVLYHAAGARVTVVDISSGMLDLDRQLAREFDFDVRLIQASMVDMPMLREGEFDLVVQPVSTCYVSEVQAVFREVARVLRPNGLYISQHKHPLNLQASLRAHSGKYSIETEIGQVAKAVDPNEPSPLRETNTIEFAHSLNTILGSICRCGMTIEDFVEPNHANEQSSTDTIGHRSRFIPPYFRVKARKLGLVVSRGPSLVLPTL